MNSNDAKITMNEMGKKKQAFFFLISFDHEECTVLSADEAATNGIFFNFNDIHYNYPLALDEQKILKLEKSPLSFEHYAKAFERVQQHLNRGNSYLVNLTFPTPIQLNESLKTIFHSTSAKYRMLHKNDFVVFSPETFIKIKQGKIYSFPMKGTIDAAIPNAREVLLSNQKELAEHATIVDLLRNDLSQIATNVCLEKFRYIDVIKTADKSLLQVSSEISGNLPENYHEQLGTIIFEMLPAGSICGAPKPKTLTIIDEVEEYKRGFYTGISGFFDGENLDSCVLIRFIENINGCYFYKSGGGITSQSVVKEEYQELIDKIYVPFN
ncbi:MAG: aminodeoxychorismate synthase component I [Prolixibacteraceae bacterium]